MAIKIEAHPSPWFEHPIRVYAHHTDYAGVVWHGTYLQWMEEARISALNQAGAAFDDLVRCNCDLPVVDLAIRYHQPLRMGDVAIATCRLNRIERVRLHFDQHIYRAGEPHQPAITAQVVLIPLDRSQGKIIRKFPPPLYSALERLQALDE